MAPPKASCESVSESCQAGPPQALHLAHSVSAMGIQGRIRPESSQEARKRQQEFEENGDQEKYDQEGERSKA